MKFSRTSADVAVHFLSRLVSLHQHHAWSKDEEKSGLSYRKVRHDLVALLLLQLVVRFKVLLEDPTSRYRVQHDPSIVNGR